MTRNAKLISGIGAGAIIAALGIATLSGRDARAGDAVVDGVARVRATAVAARGHGDTITVYRSPTCGCCKAWEDHLRDAGYTIRSIETSEVHQVKAEHAVPQPLQSCHTGLVGGYVLEGHVPAEDVVRLLAQRPDIEGLAVPGMPAGSPGMDVPGHEDDPFEVFAFRDGGAAEVWATH